MNDFAENQLTAISFMNDPFKIERILVRGTNWIGDAVMTTPALQRLRSSFPHSQITLLATPRTAGMFEDSPYFDELIEYRRREEGLGAFFGALRILRKRRFDMAVLFQNAFEAALLACLGNARLRIGFAEQGRGFLLTHKLYRGHRHRNRHQTRDYLDIVIECEKASNIEHLSSNLSNPLPHLIAGAEQKKAAEDIVGKSGFTRPLAILNAGATNSRAKCWPAERFAALADRLIEELNAQVVLIGGATELDYAERVHRSIKGAGTINLAGKTSMNELIGLLDCCDLLISNDTGPAHIAAALGRATLTIFGPTNEFETEPTGPRAEIIRAENIECARCMLRDCPIDHRCMTRISADEVFERATALMNRALL